MNIFLDTSIFVQQNFFHGKKIENLAKLSNQEIIKLYITSINDKEVKKKITDECNSLADAEKTFLRKLETSNKIVKHFFEIDELEKFSDASWNENLLYKYEKFKDFAKINIIKPKNNFDIQKLIDDYFESNPPFSNSKNKKCEFPDAISLKIIKDHLVEINQEAIFLTSDSDFKNLQITGIKIIDSIEIILEEISKLNNSEIFDDKEIITKTITENIKLFKPYISSEIELSAMIHVIDIFNEKIDSDVLTQKTKIVNVNNIDIFDVGKDYIGFNCIGNYEVEVTINDEEILKLRKAEIFDLNTLNFQNNKLTFTGNFSASLYYEYEFPYKIEKDSIEISEDEIITSIENK